MNISPEALRELVENNPKLVTRKQSTRYRNLYVIKYTRDVFYSALWSSNDLLIECRGLIVDADYNMVVKPFTKVFNYQENGTTMHPDQICTAVRKINGFMCAVTLDYDNSYDLIISTTGSLDSDFVDLAYKHIKPYEDVIREKFVLNLAKPEKVTLLFEICDESDPHIIKEEYGAWLIGANCYIHENEHAINVYESVLDRWAAEMGFKRPEAFYGLRFSDVLDMNRKCCHEGFMVIGGGVTLKLKSPYYLVTKFLARMTEKKFNTLVQNNNKAEAYRRFDEEYYDLIDYVFGNPFMWRMLSEQGKIECIREFLNREK